MSDPASNGFAGPGPDAVYRANLAAGTLALQVCAACGGKQFFRRARSVPDGQAPHD